MKKFEDLFETKSIAFCCGMIFAVIILVIANFSADLIVDEIIKQQQIHNCEILIHSYEYGLYTEAELRNNSTFNFSYYWGLDNDYWQCDKWFDKEQVIQDLLEKNDG